MPAPLRDRLAPDFFKNLPRSPGVYFMYGYGGSLIYVGKAKDLRARLSSYRRTVEGKVVRLVQAIEEIRIEVTESEEAALLRENALLREHRPLFNVINKNPQSYPLVGIRYFEDPTGPAQVEFWVTSRKQDFESERAGAFRWFGSFKSKHMVREGFSALLRLLWMCETRALRFDVPREIQSLAPRRPYSLPLTPAWRGALESFWAGRSPRLVTMLTERLLAREDVPPHLYHAIQRDLEEVRGMYDRGPRRLRRMCLKLGIARRRAVRVTPQEEWDDLVVRYQFARKRRED